MQSKRRFFLWKYESFVKRRDTPDRAQSHLTLRPLMQSSCTEPLKFTQVICETCELLNVVPVLDRCEDEIWF